MKEPEISVGIVHALHIHFTLEGDFAAKGETVTGAQEVTFSEGGILWRGQLYRDLTFHPLKASNSFALYDVTIGQHFHWERQETQRFPGILKLVVDEGKIWAINQLPAEEYLVSVISSEMNATSSPEFLKAHAVISRSWLLAQIARRRSLSHAGSNFFPFIKTKDEHIRWYDREEHTIFDVCADDHCQRYQGITKASVPAVAESVRATAGEVLTYGSDICDARFSKCCGGVSEEFSYCWEEKDYPYLQAVRDDVTGLPEADGTDEKNGLDNKDDKNGKGEKSGNAPKNVPDLRLEAEAEAWIRSEPRSFCHTRNRRILSQILNNYDQETTDFYRWKVRYTQEELSALIRENTKYDFGDIIDLVPIERGKSGRICKLKIVGTQRELIIGKELEIRRVLSTSHLFSSAFVVDKGDLKYLPNTGVLHDEDDDEDDENEVRVPSWFELTGAGWGHGVGLCQIGAAVMGEEGYSYDQILLHYYRGAQIEKKY
jgi:SpoIID/LytB domain protein